MWTAYIKFVLSERQFVAKPEQYSQTVGKYINALLPVWMQYRDTYINLQEVLKSGQRKYFEYD